MLISDQESCLRFVHLYTMTSDYLQGEWLEGTRRGVIMTGSSLVLQSLDRRREGEYACAADNAIGEATSATIYLAVKCKYHFLPPEDSSLFTLKHNGKNSRVILYVRYVWDKKKWNVRK
jgi:hypothetical protein